MANEKITKEDIKNAKDLKATIALANEGIKDGNSLTQAFGKLLKENVKSAGAINVSIKSAADILKSQLDSQKKGVSFQDKIKNTVKEKAKLDEKIAYYDSIGHTAISEKLQTQKNEMKISVLYILKKDDNK